MDMSPKDNALDVQHDSETNHHKWGGRMVEEIGP